MDLSGSDSRKVDLVTPILSAQCSACREIRCSPSTMNVTVKQLLDCVSAPRHKGRFVINYSQVYSVRIVGMVTEIKVHDSFTDYTIYDCTGAIAGRAWNATELMAVKLKGVKEQAYYEFTGTVTAEQGIIMLSILNAFEVTNFNRITQHFLSAMMEHAELNRGVPNPDSMKPGTSTSASRVAMDLDKEAIIWMLAEDDVREFDQGASFDYIVSTMHMEAADVRRILDELISEGSVYNTIDEAHYKLCLDT